MVLPRSPGRAWSRSYRLVSAIRSKPSLTVEPSLSTTPCGAISISDASRQVGFSRAVGLENEDIISSAKVRHEWPGNTEIQSSGHTSQKAQGHTRYSGW